MDFEERAKKFAQKLCSRSDAAGNLSMRQVRAKFANRFGEDAEVWLQDNKALFSSIVTNEFVKESKQQESSEDDSESDSADTAHSQLKRSQAVKVEVKRLPAPKSHSDGGLTGTTRTLKRKEISSSSESASELEMEAPVVKKKERTGSKKKRDRGDAQSSSHASKPQKPDSTKVQHLKRYIRACGMKKRWNLFLADCKSEAARVRRLQDYLVELGVDGRPTLEKCQKVKAAREEQEELASLDVGNIIGTHGKRRTTRSQAPPAGRRAVMQESDSSDDAGLTNLRDIVDSENSDSEEKASTKWNRRVTSVQRGSPQKPPHGQDWHDSSEAEQTMPVQSVGESSGSEEVGAPSRPKERATYSSDIFCSDSDGSSPPRSGRGQKQARGNSPGQSTQSARGTHQSNRPSHHQLSTAHQRSHPAPSKDSVYSESIFDSNGSDESDGAERRKVLSKKRRSKPQDRPAGRTVRARFVDSDSSN